MSNNRASKSLKRENSDKQKPSNKDSSSPGLNKVFLLQRITHHIKKNDCELKHNDKSSQKQKFEKTIPDYQNINPQILNYSCSSVKDVTKSRKDFINSDDRNGYDTFVKELTNTQKCYVDKIWNSSDDENNTSSSSVNFQSSTLKNVEKTPSRSIKISRSSKCNMKSLKGKALVSKQFASKVKRECFDIKSGKESASIDSHDCSSDISVKINTQSDEDYQTRASSSLKCTATSSDQFETYEIKSQNIHRNHILPIYKNNIVEKFQPLYEPPSYDINLVQQSPLLYQDRIETVSPSQMDNTLIRSTPKRRLDIKFRSPINHRYHNESTSTESAYSENKNSHFSRDGRRYSFYQQKRYSNYKRTSLNSFGVRIKPQYKEFQLIGDSQLVRFAEQILHMKSSDVTPDTNSRRIGLCVSGQTIEDLYRRIKDGEYRVGHSVILLIGTNNIKKRTTLNQMCNTYSLLLAEIRKTAESLILLTVPPLPLLEEDLRHWMLLESFNNHIRKYDKDAGTVVIDTASIFVSYNNSCSNDFFEKYYGNRCNKIDKIHLNYKGLKMIQTMLDLFYFET